MSDAHRRIFLSAVSSEFRPYRRLLAKDIRRANVEVVVQEDFGNPDETTLGKLDTYIRQSDAVVHLIGDATGAVPAEAAVRAILERYPDLPSKLPPLAVPLATRPPQISYTQWEAYLALYHGVPCHIYQSTPEARRGKKHKPDGHEKKLQEAHFERIRALGRCREQFATRERLSSYVLGDLKDILPPRESDVQVSTTRLRHSAERLVGRDEALRRLDAAWVDPHKHVVVIRAWGGVGKTSLVAEWMAEMAWKGWRGARRVFDWTFYSQGTRREQERADTAASADAFVAEALRFFGDPDPQAGSPWGRGARLARLVGETRTLLVLDGLEPLQQPPGPLAGQLRDPSVAALLKGLAPMPVS